jgi:hypothetical protein
MMGDAETGSKWSPTGVPSPKGYNESWKLKVTRFIEKSSLSLSVPDASKWKGSVKRFLPETPNNFIEMDFCGKKSLLTFLLKLPSFLSSFFCTNWDTEDLMIQSTRRIYYSVRSSPVSGGRSISTQASITSTTKAARGRWTLPTEMTSCFPYFTSRLLLLQFARWTRDDEYLACVLRNNPRLQMQFDVRLDPSPYP